MDAASLSGSLVLTLDANSACASLDSSGLDNICTITGSVYTFSIYGNLTEHATNSRYNFTGTSYFYYKGTGTITTNGNTYHTWNRLYIDGVGITVTNGDDMVTPSVIYLVNGTFNSNSKNITASSIINPTTGTRGITLGSSIITLINGLQFGNSDAGLTVDAGTSKIISGADWCRGAGKTFYDLDITTVGAMGGGVGYFTCRNLTRTSGNSINANMYMVGDITVTNTLTITGANATNYRVLVQSNTIGTARTITCNGTTNITNCDFRDITLAGTANRDFSAQTDIGNCGGNSGITFPAAVTAYRVGVGNVSDATKWRTTSGGATQSRVPLPQDSAVIDANTGTGTLTMDCPRIGSIDMSAQTQAMTWALGNNISCYGHYVLGDNITPSGNFGLTLAGRGDYNVNTYGKTTYYIIIIAKNGTYTAQSNIVCTFHFEPQRGSFDLNDYNLMCLSMQGGSGNFGYTDNIVYWGNGIIELTRTTGNTWVNVATNIAEGSTILFNPISGSASITFLGGGKTYNIVRFSGAHTGSFIISSNNTYKDLDIVAGRKVQATQSSTQTVTGKLISEGTAANHASLDSTTATPFNLVYSGTGYHQTHFLDVKSCNATANRFYSRGGVDGGGNTGWLFKSYCKWPQIINIG
jgi:hypothetical protein